MPKEELPRERMIKYGKEALTNEELISIILKTGTKDISVKEIAMQTIALVDSIEELKEININTLIKIKGIGYTKAIELIASIELGRRIQSKNINPKKYRITNPSDIVLFYRNIYENQQQELFYVIYLDSKNNIIAHKLLFIGTLNKSIVHPREIFKEAYLLSANAIICLHNHPSGDSTPSKEDIQITTKLKEISQIHDVRFLDHLIIGSDNYYSFHENRKIMITETL